MMDGWMVGIQVDGWWMVGRQVDGWMNGWVDGGMVDG